MAQYADELYKSDPNFAMLVDHLYALIKKGEYAPIEIRQAVMLAMIKYDLQTAKPVLMSPEFIEKLRRGAMFL